LAVSLLTSTLAIPFILKFNGKYLQCLFTFQACPYRLPAPSIKEKGTLQDVSGRICHTLGECSLGYIIST
jgi:hypothetical protein